MEKICVAVRVRPEANEESFNGSGTFWKVEDNRISLHRALGTPISGLSYAFDHVFDQDCTNARVYELLTKDIIHAAVDGFNGTAFAYGQTSSGKTYTMNGCESDPGIIHRSVKDIFTKTKMITNREFLIRVSYMEIYNEDINDLLAVENQKLPIHESLERGVFVAGLREEIVNSAEQVLELLQRGEVNRHFGETNMNVRSSRSHTIFRMVIESKGKETGSGDYSSSDDAIRVSVLNLVDLAGSERITKTGAGGVRLKEGKHINKSLLVLGNVINKLSEGEKQRGHIPYRDSKLTRILQPALGGNAKTSIICTVAPEEAHIEESKGTLQFASRAKRITNCVQVNEILSDAALLKRQKLEIEELRMKLQGSRAEVLEQEILKLRNEMLKYELQHDTLAMELEEERRSHKQRDQEQQMKIENLSGLVACSGSDTVSTQECNTASLKEESSDSHSFCEEDAFNTSCFKAVPNSFVVRRSHFSNQTECSPLPNTYSNFADEDTWMRMNKGYIADLDSLHITPARKVQSFPSAEDLSNEDYKQEIQNLQRQLALVSKERDDLKRHHAEQISLNNQLIRDVSMLQKEVMDMQDIPRRMCESVVGCKNIYVDVLSVLESFVSGEKSATAKLLAGTRDIGTCLFSTLETHFSVTAGGDRFSTGNKSLFNEQCSYLCERLKSTISSIVAHDAPFLEEKHLVSPLPSCKYKGWTLGEEIAFWKKKLDTEDKAMKERYKNVKKELNNSNQLLEVAKDRFHSLEREFHVLKEEKDALLVRVSNSSQTLAMVTNQKDKAMQDLKIEAQRRKYLEEEIKKFSAAFSCRQNSLVSFQSDFQFIIENMKAQNLVSISKAGGSLS